MNVTYAYWAGLATGGLVAYIAIEVRPKWLALLINVLLGGIVGGIVAVTLR